MKVSYEQINMYEKREEYMELLDDGKIKETYKSGDNSYEVDGISTVVTLCSLELGTVSHSLMCITSTLLFIKILKSPQGPISQMGEEMKRTIPHHPLGWLW